MGQTNINTIKNSRKYIQGDFHNTNMLHTAKSTIKNMQALQKQIVQDNFDEK